MAPISLKVKLLVAISLVTFISLSSLGLLVSYETEKTANTVISQSMATMTSEVRGTMQGLTNATSDSASKFFKTSFRTTTIDKILQSASNDSFEGNGNMYLLDESLVVQASTDQNVVVQTSLKETLPEVHSSLDRSGTEHLETSDSFVTTATVSMRDGDTLLLAYVLPKSVALANVYEVESHLDTGFSDLTRNMAIVSVLLLLITIVVMYLLISSFVKPLSVMRDNMSALAGADGDLTQKLDVSKHKELIEIAQGFNAFTDKLRSMIVAMQQEAETLRKQSIGLASASATTADSSKQQAVETQSVATAMNEMSLTANQVSELAQSTLNQATDATNALGASMSAFDESMVQIRGVSDDMQDVTTRISMVAERSEEITTILSTIRGIAEQTNLLALNAAIEAARAGENGRGFAVVADEVRTLAARTQNSTADIENLIQALVSEVSMAVTQVSSSQEQVQSTVSATEASYSGIQQVSQLLTEINDNASQVATAAEEQSSVSEEINRNVVAIGDQGKAIFDVVTEVDSISHQIDQTVLSLDEQLGKLKV